MHVRRACGTCARSHACSYKRVKGRSHTVEKRTAMNPQIPHATSQPSRFSHTPLSFSCNYYVKHAVSSYRCSLRTAGQGSHGRSYLRGVFVRACLYAFPHFGSKRALFCNCPCSWCLQLARLRCYDVHSRFTTSIHPGPLYLSTYPKRARWYTSSLHRA